jgi:hypothetical protein
MRRRELVAKARREYYKTVFWETTKISRIIGELALAIRPFRGQRGGILVFNPLPPDIIRGKI